MDNAQKADPRDRTEAEPRHPNPTPTMEEVIREMSPLRELDQPSRDIFARSMRLALRQAGFIHRSEVLSEETVKRVAQRLCDRACDDWSLGRSLWTSEAHAALLAALGEEKADG